VKSHGSVKIACNALTTCISHFNRCSPLAFHHLAKWLFLFHYTKSWRKVVL